MKSPAARRRKTGAKITSTPISPITQISWMIQIKARPFKASSVSIRKLGDRLGLNRPAFAAKLGMVEALFCGSEFSGEMPAAGGVDEERIAVGFTLIQ
jgi:hypothetical protein